jgi:hypothetical protein
MRNPKNAAVHALFPETPEIFACPDLRMGFICLGKNRLIMFPDLYAF